MKTLVIYAHPDTPAHCPWILECVERWLKASKQGYELLDLYKMKYDPILHEDEHYTSGGRTVSPVNQRIQKKVAESSHFIFIYPIWWNSPPAILKGFLEKIVWPRFAFRFSKLGIPVKLLRGKKALLFTTSSSPALFCGFKTRYCHFGNCKVLTEKRKMRMERKVIRRLSRFF